MREFAHRAGLDDALGPERPKFMHVTGTNGKGSVTAYLQSILHESGYRTGVFFSPYVYDPRERIQLGRELIPEAIFAGLTSMLIPVAEEFTDTDFGGISEFEFKAAMAFLFYKRLECEWVALEVGLGGRLDATNIVTPACSIVVSVALDHTNILGDTIEQIAHEKAGIIKPGVPVILGQMPPEALAVMEAEAERNHAPVWRYGVDITVAQDAADGSIVVRTPHGEHAGLKLGIRGAMQGHNMALAVAACDAAGATRTLGGLQRGVANASIPGRFEIRHCRNRTVVLDGAHNPDAARVLVDSLTTYRGFGRLPGSPGQIPTVYRTGKVWLIAGMVAGHDPSAFFALFEGVADHAVAVPIDFHRSLAKETVAEAMASFVPDTTTADNVADALRKVLDLAGEEDLILITGSFYLVGEAGNWLSEYEGCG
jgi:dihydrofolate synthase/folylpolyglutamate synthase